MRKALLIGCNYPGTKAELHGCVNDVSRMYKCLKDKFNFADEDITVMIDTDKASVQPTGVNIKKVLARLIDEVQPGDVLFLHYSGHGTQVPAESGDEEDDGFDEAIVPCDLNLLTDDDFRLLFKNIKDGVNFTFVSDSCHSGGLIDHEKEQIVGTKTREFSSEVTRNYNFGEDDEEEEGGEPVAFKNKSLSLDTLSEMLSQKTGHEVKPGSIRTSLFELFGDNASPTVKVFVNFIADKLSSKKNEEGGEGSGRHQHSFFGKMSGLAVDFLKAKLDDNDSKPAHGVPSAGISHSGHAGKKPLDPSQRVADDTGVLVSGCMSNETSADANPTGDTSKAYGALSNGIQTVLQQKRGSITNVELVTEVRKLLKKQGFTQHPCLYCSDANVSRPFICDF
ncbi:hypothetical protein R1flu_012277 [Riccia fluitans]|uniref:Peptidase C14 caspase domain-containing protein n=1 Tax=Riccia fluitans TaxID=41844 RepID=A0ABD1ZB41_9MARC